MLADEASRQLFLTQLFLFLTQCHTVSHSAAAPLFYPSHALCMRRPVTGLRSSSRPSFAIAFVLALVLAPAFGR